LGQKYTIAQENYQWWLKMKVLGPALTGGYISNGLAKRLFESREAVEKAHCAYHRARRLLDG